MQYRVNDSDSSAWTQAVAGSEGVHWVPLNIPLRQNEPRCEKTGLRGFRPGPIYTQTALYSHRRWLDA